MGRKKPTPVSLSLEDEAVREVLDEEAYLVRMARQAHRQPLLHEDPPTAQTPAPELPVTVTVTAAAAVAVTAVLVVLAIALWAIWRVRRDCARPRQPPPTPTPVAPRVHFAPPLHPHQCDHTLMRSRRAPMQQTATQRGVLSQDPPEWTPIAPICVRHDSPPSSVGGSDSSIEFTEYLNSPTAASSPKTAIAVRPTATTVATPKTIRKLSSPPSTKPPERWRIAFKSK